MFHSNANVQVMRVLGRTRLSRSTEESTSIERQREIIESWANQHGHEVIGWAEDIDVSGSVDPFDTPELGPWLTEERMGEWDILCAWKMDRLARRTVPLHRLIGWTQDNDKTLVCVADNIDLSHWVGRLVASVIAGVAEGELEAISERLSASQRKLREVGRWHGGRIPYGFRPLPLETGGYTFEHDPEQVAVIRRMVEMVLEGNSAYKITNELNDSGIKAPAAPKWSVTAVLRVLRNKALLGWTTHQGQTIRDAEGKPVLKGPPIITHELYDKIQAELAKRTVSSRQETPSPLLGIAKCWHCGKNLHFQVNRPVRGRPQYTYFYCSDKCDKSINGEALVEIVYDQFLNHLGDYERLEKQVAYPVDHSGRLTELRDAISELSKLLGTVGSATAIASISSQIEALDAELAALESEHSAETVVTWIPTGQTYSEYWETLDTEGKRQLLLRSGVEVPARQLKPGTRTARGTVELDLQLPHDLMERLNLKKGTQ